MNKPNIILINCDDLGYGDLGCYGSTQNNTPHLDQLAEQGRRFTDFYMASPVCSPSRGAMMTGCYPPRVGFGDFDGEWVLFPGQRCGLNPKEQTLGKLLKQAGYATAHIGKWHCGDQPEFLPTAHGFDQYFGIPYSNDMGRQVDRPNSPPLPLMEDDQVYQEQPDQRSITERYTQRSVKFIRENRDGPFFLYLAHMYVHVPLFVSKRWLESSRNGAYGGAVECIDWSTGVIMDTLKQLGIERDTLVIFTSDNGSRARGEGGSNAPCRGHKSQTWEGGIRLPCVMRWPGVIPEGSTCDAIARSIDLLPTFANLAGVDSATAIPRPVDGVDITSLMTGSGDADNNTMAYYFHNQLEAVRVGDWKLHFRKWDELIQALYNLRDDVGETNNVYAEHPEIVADLETLAGSIRAVTDDPELRADVFARLRPAAPSFFGTLIVVDLD